MNTRYKKIAIVGAGAIGGWIGNKLAKDGAEVSVLARNETLANIKASGLKLFENNAESIVRVNASDKAEDLGIQDLIIIALKAPSLPNLAPQIKPLIGKDTVILTAMNGIPWWFLHNFGNALKNQTLSSTDPNGVIQASIPANQVIGCVVHASCSADAPGTIRHHFGNRLIIGEPAGGDTERLLELEKLLTSAGYETEVSPQIQKDIWYKLWGNMTVNPISAITSATTDQIMSDDLVRGFASHIMLEAKLIGSKIGIDIDQSPEDRHVITRKMGAFKTSMLQDVQAKKQVEIDALIGAVHELGQKVNVETPFINALFGLSRLHAKNLGIY